MESSEKLGDKIQQLHKAISGLLKLLKVDESLLKDEVMKDAIENGRVQKFEYCIELCWKTGKKFLEVEMKKYVRFPVQVFKELYLGGLLSQQDYDILSDAIETRNKFSHIYKEDYFRDKLPYIPKYAEAMSVLASTLENYLSKKN